MSDHEVRYTISLADLMSGKIKAADSGINHLEGSLHSAARAGHRLAGAIAGVVSVYAGFAFLKSSLNDFEESQSAIAQLSAGIASTAGAAGVSIDYLTQSAKKFTKTLPFAKDQIMDMQSQLLTFPSITKNIFNDASQSILDMATRLHHGLDETAIMVGKALQDPARGIVALRRVGVNFNDEQTKIIKNLVATGHAGQAQAKILKELQTEFAGSALAAGNTFAGQMQLMSNQITEYKEKLGSYVADMIMALRPAIEWAIKAFGSLVGVIKDMVTWVKENKVKAELLAVAIGAVAGAVALYEIVTTAAAIATKAMVTMQWAWNIAISANPIGLLIIGVAAVTAAIIYCYKHFGTFRAVLLGVWETVKEFGRIVGDIFMGLGKVIKGTLTLNPSLILEGFNQTLSAIANAGNRLGHAFKTGYDEGIADFAKDQATAAAPHPIVAVGKPGKPGSPGTDGNAGIGKAPKAQGAKNITININGGLVHSFVTHVRNMQEGVGELRDHVTAALLSAVNDSQVIAAE